MCFNENSSKLLVSLEWKHHTKEHTLFGEKGLFVHFFNAGIPNVTDIN